MGLSHHEPLPQVLASVLAPHPSPPRAPRSFKLLLVMHVLQVVDVETKEKFSQLKIKFPQGKVESTKLGASVAINGTCLTVTEIQKDTLSFDIMMETLRATNLGELGAGSVVNFERAAKLGDEIGGHAVSGHVHTTATISNIETFPNNRKVTITLNDERWAKYVLPKGYIAVDGTSLTVGEVSGSSFTVYLIPETLRVTVFGIKSVGDTVNIEVETQTQAIVDTVERVVDMYMARLGASVWVDPGVHAACKLCNRRGWHAGMQPLCVWGSCSFA